MENTNSNNTQFFKAQIVKVLSEETTNTTGEPTPVQHLLVRLTNANGKQSEVTVNHGQIYTIAEDQKVKPGENVIVSLSDGPDGKVYNIYDNDRSTPLMLLFGLFVGVVLITARKKGIGALLALGLSMAVIIYAVIPLVIKGWNPALVSLVGAMTIVSTSIFLAHGFNRRTLIAWASTAFTLILATLLGLLSIHLLHMTGTASEDTFFLSMGGFQNIELKGLLLGGLIIGTLGVLDDVTTAQVAAVYELKSANKELKKKQLISHAMAIGKEHILAVVNTLVLAYAGSSLPLMIIFTVSSELPLWVLLNNELVIEEVLRTLVGSIALVLAVPISTVLAAHYIDKNPQETLKETSSGHHHAH